MAVIVYDNLDFHEDKNGYFVGPRKIRRQRLHRYVWEKFNGPIPNGYIVHHIDHDKSNNTIDNLSIMTQSDHATYHGKNITDCQRRKMSEANKGERNYFYGVNHKGRNNPHYGKKHTEEAKRIMGKDKKRAVMCEETGTIYDSIKDAFEKTSIHNISACCRGVIAKAGGYSWSYYKGGDLSP